MLSELELDGILSRKEDTFFDRTRSLEKNSKDSVGSKIAAFATSQGGWLLFGQADDKKLVGIGERGGFIRGLSELLQNLEPVPTVEGPLFFERDGKLLAALRIIALGSGGPCSFKGVAYQRVQESSVKISPKELYRIWSSAGRLYFEERPSIAPLTAIDHDSLDLYLRGAKSRGEVNMPAFLEAKKLAKGDFLTNLGVLVLSKKPDDWLPNARIHVVRFKGTTPSERSAALTLSMPIHKLVASAIDFIKTFLPVREKIEGIKRFEQTAIPEYVLREVLVNALAHRDYENPGEVLVRIFDDRFEISNPGAPTPEEWKKILFSGIPVHRNPRIYEFLREANLGEGVGQGIPEIRKRLKEVGAAEPVFFVISDTFALMLNFKPLRGGHDALLEKALKLVREEGTVSSTRVMNALGISRPFAIRLLNELVAKHFLVHSGGGKTSKYSFSVDATVEAKEDAEDAREVDVLLKEENAGKRKLYNAKEFEKRTGAKIT